VLQWWKVVSNCINATGVKSVDL